MSTVPSWKVIAAIPSDRAAFAGRPITAFVVDDLSGEELERISLIPGKDRLGYCLWTKDLAVRINEQSSFIRAGVLASGAFTQEASSYTNKIHAAIGGLRAFTTALHPENWVAAGDIDASRAITLGEAVSVVVSDEVTGTVYERLMFHPDSDHLTASQWRKDLATFTNANSLYVKAGRAWYDHELDKEKIKTGGQEMFYAETGKESKFWVPKGSGLKVTSSIVPWREINFLKSDRAVTVDQKVMVFAVDEITDEELERITFAPARGRMGYCLWIKDFCVQINQKSSYLRAGEIQSAGNVHPYATSYANRLYTAHEHVRAFSTVLRQDNWVDAGAIPAPRAMEKHEVVVVRVCNEGTGKLYETLEFKPDEARLKAWEWRQDLAKFLNEKSDYVRAGRLYTKDEVDETKFADEGHSLFYPSTGECRFWVPFGSYLVVRSEIASWRLLNEFKADRAINTGQQVTAFVVDETNEEEVERITFTAGKERLGLYAWLHDCATYFNSKSSWVRFGELSGGNVKPIAGTSYRDSIYTYRPYVRAFTTTLRPDNWLDAGIINAPKDLKLGDPIIIRVCSEATGQVRETLTFTVEKDRTKAAQWRQDLARFINTTSIYMRAGREYTPGEQDAVHMQTVAEPLFYASERTNHFWLPRNSGLCVEVDDWMKVTAAPPVIPCTVNVDPRTGAFQADIEMGTLVGNKGHGPSLDVVLNVSKKRVDLRVSFLLIKWPYSKGGCSGINPEMILSICGGETYKLNPGDVDLTSTIYFPTFKLECTDIGEYQVVHKSGEVEVLSLTRKARGYGGPAKLLQENEELYLPTRITTSLGMGLSLKWIESRIDGQDHKYWIHGDVSAYPILTLLTSISDDDGVKLLEGEYSAVSASITLNPNHATLRHNYKVEFDHREELKAFQPIIRDGKDVYTDARVRAITVKDAAAGTSAIEFLYAGENLSQIKSASGLVDSLRFDGNGRVSSHSRLLGANGPAAQAKYSYTSEADSKTKEVVLRRTSVERTSGSNKVLETFCYQKDGGLKEYVLSTGDCSSTTTQSRSTDAKTKQTTIKVERIYAQGGTSRAESSSMVFDEFGNAIRKIEKGVTTEWTYYSGDPKVKRTEVDRKRVDAQASIMGLIFGWAMDFANPIGWGMNIFSDRGFTWGTDYDYEVKLLPGKTTLRKAATGLPMDMLCLGDPNFFTWLVATERVYTHVDDKRVDLYWNFYEYDTIPVKGGDKDHPAIVPTWKVTLRDPVSADGAKADSYSGGEVEKIDYYADPAQPVSYGRIKKASTWLLDSSGAKIVDSLDETTYTYKELKGDLLQTVASLEAGSIGTTVNWVSGLKIETHDRFYNRTRWDYGKGGRVCKVTNTTLGGEVLSEAVHRYEIVVDGTRVETQVSGGAAQRVQYDALGREVRAQSWISPALGWRTLSSQEFDGSGRVAQSAVCDYTLGGKLLSRDVQKCFYDDWGQLSKTCGQEAGGQVTHVQFDPVAQTRTVWVEADGEVGFKTVTVLNDNAAPVKITLADASGTVLDEIEHAYTSKGELSRVKGKHSKECTYEYDLHGRQVKQNSAGVVTTNYYPTHTKKAIATLARVQDDYNYSVGSQVLDKYLRVTQFERNGRTTDYRYGSNDNWIEYVGVEDPASATEPLRPDKHEQTYDQQRLILSESFQGKAGLLVGSTCRYSLQGRAVEVVDPFAGTTYYRYDRMGRFVGVSSAVVYSTSALDGTGSVRAEHIHDKFSQLTAAIAFQRDALGRETERCVVVPGFNDFLLRRWFDDSGKLSKAETITRKEGVETHVRREHFSYEADGRLKKYSCDKGVGPMLPGDHQVREQTFKHDSGGMKQFYSKTTHASKGDTSGATEYTFRHAAQTGKMSTAEIATMTGKVEVTSIQHDDHGRLAAMSSEVTGNKRVSLSYNKEGSLHAIQYQDPSGSDGKAKSATPLSSYAYDDNGRLVSCISADYTQDILYKGDAPYAAVRKWNSATAGIRQVALLNESDACQVQRVLSVPGKGAQSILHTLEIKDAHGTVVASYDLSSKTSRMFSYTPYGYRKVDPDDTTWIGFNGQPIDTHLGGIYHLGDGHRVYDPTLQRFHAPDAESPFGLGGANAYAYCKCDPVNHSDPSGRVVIGRETERNGSYLSDPLGNEIFFAVIGIGLGIASGGASLGLMGAIFGGTVASGAAGLGFGALATEESNPDLSGTLRMFSFALDFDGTFGSIMAHNIAGKGGRVAAGLGRISGVRNLPLAGGIQGSINALHKKKGTALGNLYVGGPNSKRLVINAHGAAAIGDRIPLPNNMTMEFFTRKGTYLWANWQGIDKHLKAGAMRPRVGKIDTPDYYLSPVDQAWFGKSGMPAHNLKDIGSYLKRTAVLNDVDILEITGNVKLSQVFDWLQSQGTYHYQHVSGHFCRGSLPSTLSQKWLRVGRRLGLHHVWPFTGSPA